MKCVVLYVDQFELNLWTETYIARRTDLGIIHAPGRFILMERDTGMKYAIECTNTQYQNRDSRDVAYWDYTPIYNRIYPFSLTIFNE